MDASPFLADSCSGFWALMQLLVIFLLSCCLRQLVRRHCTLRLFAVDSFASFAITSFAVYKYQSISVMDLWIDSNETLLD